MTMTTGCHVSHGFCVFQAELLLENVLRKGDTGGRKGQWEKPQFLYKLLQFGGKIQPTAVSQATAEHCSPDKLINLFWWAWNSALCLFYFSNKMKREQRCGRIHWLIIPLSPHWGHKGSNKLHNLSCLQDKGINGLDSIVGLLNV